MNKMKIYFLKGEKKYEKIIKRIRYDLWSFRISEYVSFKIDNIWNFVGIFWGDVGCDESAF